MTSPLPPRSERCPEPECREGAECWRCDYEESQALPLTGGCVPGSMDELIPAHLLARLASYPLYYTSTACQAAAALSQLHGDLHFRRTWDALEPGLSEQLKHWRSRLHRRCRLTNKFTGRLCECSCHTDPTDPANPTDQARPEGS